MQSSLPHRAGPNRQVGALVLLTLLVLGCRSLHHADIPIDGINKLSATDLSHCLKTLGLTDMSNEPANSAEIAKEKSLVAVWASPRYESRWHLGSTAYVRHDASRWRVTFLPGAPRQFRFDRALL